MFSTVAIFLRLATPPTDSCYFEMQNHGMAVILQILRSTQHF